MWTRKNDKAEKRVCINRYHLKFQNVLTSVVTDIFITLNETAAENWSFGQGVAQLVKMKGEQNDE